MDPCTWPACRCERECDELDAFEAAQVEAERRETAVTGSRLSIVEFWNRYLD